MTRGSVGFKVEGVNQVVRGLQSIGLEVDDLKDAFSAIATRGTRIASSAAPHRSGRLAASVRGNRAKNKAIVTAGRAAVPYAGPINYGWAARNIGPSGFMEKADDELRGDVLELLEQEINSAIRRRGLDG